MLIISWRGATYPDNVCALFQGKIYEILNAPSFLLKAFLPHLCHHLEHKTLHSKTGKNSNVVLMIYKQKIRLSLSLKVSETYLILVVHVIYGGD